eukprot:symbB.v1.2.037226.t1/scaffold5438.1/size27190/3
MCFVRADARIAARLEVFCFTTGTCLDLDIDAPPEVLWNACMNPLLIPDSCRTKGIHPPGTSREEMETWDRDL